MSKIKKIINISLLVFTISVFVALVAVLMKCALVSCEKSREKKDEELEIFNAFHGDALERIATGAKSDKTDFKIDDITLDFCYGGSEIAGYYEHQNRQALGVAVYFIKPDAFEAFRDSRYGLGVQDYKTIEGFHFVKFIETEEYNTEEYRTNFKMFRKIKIENFNHKETLTIPSSLIVDSNDKSVAFAVIRICLNKEQGTYGYDCKGSIILNYEFLDEQTVRLSYGGELR